MTSELTMHERPKLSDDERGLRDEIKRSRKQRWTGAARVDERAEPGPAHKAKVDEGAGGARALPPLAALFEANFTDRSRRRTTSCHG